MQGKWGVFRGRWNVGVGHITKETAHFYMLENRPTGGLYSKRQEKDLLLHAFDTEAEAQAGAERYTEAWKRAEASINDAEAALRTLRQAQSENAIAALKREA